MRTVINNGNGTQTVVALQDGNLITGTSQDCTAIAEYAKARHKAGLVGSSEMRLAASVPFVIVEKYCNDNRITMAEFKQSQEHKKRLLSAPENADFRIWKGKL